MPSVSAIILTRDSQRTIEACLQALKPAVDSIIVVDTGSTDDTVQIAKDNGARVYRFEWRDDFAAARNFGDSLAVTEWVIQVDSDEILREEDTDKIRKLCVQFRKTIKSTVVGIQIINKVGEIVQVDIASRLYKRSVFVWQGIIHEQLITRRGEPAFMVASEAGLLHDGYDPEKVNVRDKIISRNIRMLKKELEQKPDNALYHFFLGRDYTGVGEYESAISHLRICIDLFEQQNIVMLLEQAHKVLIECLEKIGDYSGAQEVGNLMVSKFDNYEEGWYEAATQK